MAAAPPARLYVQQRAASGTPSAADAERDREARERLESHPALVIHADLFNALVDARTLRIVHAESDAPPEFFARLYGVVARVRLQAFVELRKHAGRYAQLRLATTAEGQEPDAEPRVMPAARGTGRGARKQAPVTTDAREQARIDERRAAETFDPRVDLQKVVEKAIELGPAAANKLYTETVIDNAGYLYAWRLHDMLAAFVTLLGNLPARQAREKVLAVVNTAAATVFGERPQDVYLRSAAHQRNRQGLREMCVADAGIVAERLKERVADADAREKLISTFAAYYADNIQASQELYARVAFIFTHPTADDQPVKRRESGSLILWWRLMWRELGTADRRAFDALRAGGDMNMALIDRGLSGAPMGVDATSVLAQVSEPLGPYYDGPAVAEDGTGGQDEERSDLDLLSDAEREFLTAARIAHVQEEMSDIEVEAYTGRVLLSIIDRCDEMLDDSAATMARTDAAPELPAAGADYRDVRLTLTAGYHRLALRAYRPGAGALPPWGRAKGASATARRRWWWLFATVALLRDDALERRGPPEPALFALDELLSFWEVPVTFASRAPRNMRIVGPAGTGKTTFARTLDALWHLLGVFPLGTPRPSEVAILTPSSFVAAYEGQTKSKTRNQLIGLLGRAQPLDEAYALATDRGYGRQALDEIVARALEFSSLACLQLIGYEKQIKELLQVNEGLSRRFERRLAIRAYRAAELLDVFEARYDDIMRAPMGAAAFRVDGAERNDRFGFLRAELLAYFEFLTGELPVAKRSRLVDDEDGLLLVVTVFAGRKGDRRSGNTRTIARDALEDEDAEGYGNVFGNLNASGIEGLLRGLQRRVMRRPERERVLYLTDVFDEMEQRIQELGYYGVTALTLEELREQASSASGADESGSET
jgi:hypothetical protein